MRRLLLSVPLLGRRGLRRTRRVVGATAHVDAGMRLSGNHLECGEVVCFNSPWSAWG